LRLPLNLPERHQRETEKVLASWLDTSGVLLSVLPPLVAVPLTVLTFYLRSLREHQVTWHADLVRRVESLDGSANELRRTLLAFERDYTSKEEWLRECVQTRGTLARLSESTVRIEALVGVLGRYLSPPSPTASSSRPAGAQEKSRSATD